MYRKFWKLSNDEYEFIKGEVIYIIEKYNIRCIPVCGFEIASKMKIKLLYEKMKSLLKDRERTILELRFGLDGHKPKTQIEIAEQMGISRSYVSRIEKRVLSQLRDKFESRGVEQ